jgi:hypothetical protein
MLALILGCGAVLTGCGSGGGEEEDEEEFEPEDASADGIWSGTLTPDGASTNKSIVGVATADGEFAFLVVSDTQGVGLFGTGATDAFSVTANGTAYASVNTTLANGAVSAPVQLTGTVSERSQIVGRYSYGGESGRMILNYMSLYGRPSSLETLAGVYTFPPLGDRTSTIAINSNGQLTINRSDGCVSNGAFQLIEPTTNAYRGSWTSSMCGPGDGEWDAIAILEDVPNGAPNSRVRLFMKAAVGTGWAVTAATK